MASKEMEAPEVIPVGQSTGSTKNSYGNIIQAISQIQQYAVIEGSGQEIPDDFLTIEGKLNFFKVGLGSGFIEGIIFAALTAVMLPVMADPHVSQYVTHYFPLAGYRPFLLMFNCLPILIIGGICCFLSRFRLGVITRKSVDSLLIGRVFSLLIKGGLIFILFIFVANRIDAEIAWKVAKVFSLWKEDQTTHIIYRIIWNMKPYLIKCAYEVLFIFAISAVIPFVSTWLVSAYRNHKARREEKFWNS